MKYIIKIFSCLKSGPPFFSKVIATAPYNTSSIKYVGDNSHSDRHSRTFGFQEVTPSEKRQKVQYVFDDVATKYDLMNDVMSIGVHRFWKDYLIHKLAVTPDMKLLDVAGGTGDIAFRFLNAIRCEIPQPDFPILSENGNKTDGYGNVTVLDMNENMLSVCRERAKNNGLDKYIACIQGNAECLPFSENIFDVYTIAFGIRNVVHIDQALSEAYRVLRNGGRFVCLEFSEVENNNLHKLYTWYSKEIIPVLGHLIAGKWKAYQYLVESIQLFPNQECFGLMIKDAGFKNITHENLFNGIAAIHSGYKL